MDGSQKQDVELAEIPSNPPTDHTDPEVGIVTWFFFDE